MKKSISIFLSLVIVVLSLTAASQLALAATAPKKPTGVTAYAVSTSKICVKWKKSKGAKKYRVYRSTKKDGKYKKVATVKGTKYYAKELNKSTRYYFKVKAVNGKKASKFSTRVSAKTHRTYKKSVLSKAYAKVIDGLVDKYGSPSVQQFTKDSENNYESYYVDGVSYVKYKDLDNNGVPELIVCYCKGLEKVYIGDDFYSLNSEGGKGYVIKVYTYNDGKAKCVYTTSPIINGSSGSAPEYISFSRRNHRDLLLEVPELDGYVPTYCKGLSDGKVKTIYTYKVKVTEDNIAYYRGNTKISETEYLDYCDYLGAKYVDATRICDMPENDCNNLIQEVNDTIAQIKSLVK